MVPMHSRWYHHQDAHMCVVFGSLSQLCADGHRVGEMFQKKCGWTAGAGESVGSAVINLVSFQSRSQAVLLHTSQTHTYLQSFCLPSAFTDLHRWKRKLFIHTTIHQAFTPCPASMTEWKALSLLPLQHAGKKSGIKWEKQEIKQHRRGTVVFEGCLSC